MQNASCVVEENLFGQNDKYMAYAGLQTKFDSGLFALVVAAIIIISYFRAFQHNFKIYDLSLYI